MITITKATFKDANLLSKLGAATFIESHGRSAPQQTISEYVLKKFSITTVEKELKEAHNIYYIINFNEQPVGYSKIIFNYQYSNIAHKNVAKLERLYVLEDFHGLKLGFELFNFNRQEAIKNEQQGIWVFVWTENIKATGFYKKLGFKKVGYHDFEISPTHYNPNYQMLLLF